MRVLIIIITLFTPITLFAASQTAEGIVISGLTAYKKGGALPAIKAWVKGSGLENSKSALTQANTLRQIEDYYGSYQSYEIINIHKISKRSKMVLFVMNYEKGIAFSKFQAYKSNNDGWIATEFKFHTQAAVIWPRVRVYGD